MFDFLGFTHICACYTVPFATADEIDRAIRLAHAAFEKWKRTPVGARMRIMLRCQALVREHLPHISKTLSAEQGKTLADAEGDIFRGLEVVEHACSVGSLGQGEFLENVAGGVDTYSLRQPIGVCAGISTAARRSLMRCARTNS